MGFIYGQLGSYGLGLALLAVVALGALLLTVTAVARAAGQTPATAGGKGFQAHV
jgi:NNP family nitrate/nitrite transporter-like MFS transporter